MMLHLIIISSVIALRAAEMDDVREIIKTYAAVEVCFFSNYACIFLKSNLHQVYHPQSNE